MKVQNRMMAALCLGFVSLLLAGCSNTSSGISDFSKLSRAEQEKLMAGDPAKKREMRNKMRARSGPVPGSPAALQTQPR
jgi:predicted small secreted protein